MILELSSNWGDSVKHCLQSLCRETDSHELVSQREGLSHSHWQGLPLDMHSGERKELPGWWLDVSHYSKETSKWWCRAAPHPLFIYFWIYSPSGITTLMRNKALEEISCRESPETMVHLQSHLLVHIQNLRPFIIQASLLYVLYKLTSIRYKPTVFHTPNAYVHSLIHFRLGVSP